MLRLILSQESLQIIEELLFRHKHVVKMEDLINKCGKLDAVITMSVRALMRYQQAEGRSGWGGH
jgi:hypothetical protein